MGDIWRSKANKRKFRRALSFKAIVRNLRFLSAERFHHFGYFYNRERGTEEQGNGGTEASGKRYILLYHPSCERFFTYFLILFYNFAIFVA